MLLSQEDESASVSLSLPESQNIEPLVPVRGTVSYEKQNLFQIHLLLHNIPTQEEKDNTKHQI